MILVKNLNNAVHLTVLKIDNIILVFIGRKSVNILAKNTTQSIY